ncbi:hypothetical protein CRUP_037588 [Coryphaenoides rupestris]|nr:hypothetical protein CRUP_037588 [Coryphaenoides rupestris]
MYMLVCNLSTNGIYGSTALMPLLLKQILSQSYEISVSGCRLQVFAIHTYAIVEFSILAAMSYDRYVAICRPLHYHVTLPLSKQCRSRWSFSLSRGRWRAGQTIACTPGVRWAGGPDRGPGWPAPGARYRSPRESACSPALTLAP